MQCCVLWLLTDLLSILKAVDRSGGIQGSPAVPSGGAVCCCQSSLLYRQSMERQIYQVHLISLPSCHNLCLNTTQSHTCALFCPASLGACAPGSISTSTVLSSPFSSPGMSSKTCVSSYTCPKSCVFSGVPPYQLGT